jgi:hypothetical protein
MSLSATLVVSWGAANKEFGLLRGTEGAVQEKPGDDGDGQVHDDLSPHHIDVRASKGVLVASRLLHGLPYRQETKAECEPGRQRGDLVIALRGHGQKSGRYVPSLACGVLGWVGLLM